MLLVTPLLRSLRRAYPEAIIDVLVYEHKGGMLEGNPDCNDVISVAEHPDIHQYRRLWHRLFRSYDLAISTLPGDRPIIYALLAASQRVAVVPPQRWQDAWKRLVISKWSELDNEQTHTVIQNLRLADLLKIPRCYEVVVPHIPHSSALDKWQPTPFAVLHLFPMWTYKRWTLKGWQQLVNYFTHLGLRVVLTGGQDEIPSIHEALSDMPKTVVNLAGKLRFGEVAQLLKAAKIYVGPDTALTHLAAATGTFTVALYGPTNPLKWAPWPCGYALDKTPFQAKGHQRVGNVLLIQAGGSCVPCHQEGCERHKQSKSLCLEALEGEMVIEEIRQTGWVTNLSLRGSAVGWAS